MHGQRVEIIRVRRGADPDLIVRLPDGYHGALAASLTDYASAPGIAPSEVAPPRLSIEGLWQIATYVEQRRRGRRQLPSPGADEI
jgi:hypothetical protein